MHRLALCMSLLLLVGTVYADERAYEETGETWVFGSDEGGSGSSYLGVDIADVTTERLSALKLKEEHGAEITMVDQDAPAGKAGLHEHDVIVSLNGAGVESAAQLRRMIKETPAGRIVNMGISRDGQAMTIKVQLADRRKSMAWEPFNHEFNFPTPQMPTVPDIDLPISVVIAHSSLRSGLMVENITPQLGEFFGVKGGNGVLVRSVEKGSRGEKAGFHAGDVIVKVNNQSVHDASDFTHAVRSSASGTASVTVMRDKREQNLTLSLPEKKDSGQLMEDSFEIPEITAETRIAIEKSRKEIARLGPTMERAQRSLHAEEVERRTQQRLQEQQQRMVEREKQLREQQEKMLQRQEKLRHQNAGQWADI